MSQTTEVKKKSKMEKCPGCGQEFDPAKDKILTCPRCNLEGSTACCCTGGVGCICVECEENG
jgi:hypothetical protein